MREGDCASCGLVASRGRPQTGSDRALFHCSACWGETDSDDRPLPTPAWWLRAEAAAWFNCVSAALERRSYTLPNGQRLSVMTDREGRYFQGVGAQEVWPAAEVLCRYLASSAAGGPAAPSGGSGVVVELGAGVGVPGMMIARSGQRVVLTDLPWLLPLTALNLDANFACDEAHRPALHAVRWGSRRDAQALIAQHGQPSLVIGSDICYEPTMFSSLLDTLSLLGAPCALLAVTLRDGCDMTFSAAATKRGWAVSRWWGWDPSPGGAGGACGDMPPNSLLRLERERDMERDE
mmetsp:Transcript_41026/g.112755  ORF Transcript_41026/g.112755 Transcript_41026/m.112755 type:complete len:292 (+) Transcript_41026:41-916(+)